MDLYLSMSYLYRTSKLTASGIHDCNPVHVYLFKSSNFPEYILICFVKFWSIFRLLICLKIWINNHNTTDDPRRSSHFTWMSLIQSQNNYRFCRKKLSACKYRYLHIKYNKSLLKTYSCIFTVLHEEWDEAYHVV